MTERGYTLTVGKGKNGSTIILMVFTAIITTGINTGIVSNMLSTRYQVLDKLSEYQSIPQAGWGHRLLIPSKAKPLHGI